MGFLAQGSEFRVWHLGFGVLRVSGLWLPGLEFGISGFGFVSVFKAYRISIVSSCIVSSSPRFLCDPHPAHDHG